MKYKPHTGVDYRWWKSNTGIMGPIFERVANSTTRSRKRLLYEQHIDPPTLKDIESASSIPIGKFWRPVVYPRVWNFASINQF